MRHTPGPWKWDGYTDRWAEPSRLTSEKSVVISLNDRFSGYDECGDDLRMDVSEADRALIAAAPDIFSCLVDCMTELATKPPVDIELWKRCIAAYAKATNTQVAINIKGDANDKA